MPLDDWPRGEPSGAELLRRRERILDAVASGRAEHEWCPLQLADSSGNVLHLRVSCDALKIDGVRVNVDATVQQQVADRLGALLLTPKLVDEIYRRSAKLPPSPQPITASVEGMIAHSGRVDQLARDRQARTPPALANVGKDWVITKRLFTPENVSARKAANYGWLGTEVSKFPSVTGLPIIQNIGLVHSRDHSDYSQQARFVHRKAIWNEQPVDLADVYIGRAPGTGLVSHEGALPGARMPDAGTTPPTPTGPPPSTKTPSGGTPAAGGTAARGTGFLVAGLAAGAAAGAAVAGPPGAVVGGLAGLLFGQAARVA